MRPEQEARLLYKEGSTIKFVERLRKVKENLNCFNIEVIFIFKF